MASQAPEKCPVDHESRQKWMEAAQEEGRRKRKRDAIAQEPATTIPTALLHRHGATKYSLDSGRWEADPSKFVLLHASPASPPPATNILPTDREISTIPRSHDTQSATLNSAEQAALPANSERDTGHDRHSGNWIYPSQDMFFNAMKRKGHDPQSADMATIVPIHNAVNERAWAEIKAWEAGRGAEACGGPKLASFSGDSTKLSPRAWFNSLAGYQKPFDRHDWVIDRCGKRVEYIIDFYSGKDEGLSGKSLSFHLDVRPKLNTWEGIKTRMSRAAGF